MFFVRPVSAFVFASPAAPFRPLAQTGLSATDQSAFTFSTVSPLVVDKSRTPSATWVPAWVRYQRGAQHCIQPFVIEQIRRREVEREQERSRLPLRLPLDDDYDPAKQRQWEENHPKEYGPENDRGVTVIDH